MPHFFRTSSPQTFVHSTHLPESKSVAFSPITSSSRPLSSSELWPLWYFETHARACDYCRDPYEVHRDGGRLCDQGHTYAQDVADSIYSRGNGSRIYAVGDADHLVQVEIPKGYSNVRSLLRAMERGLRHRRQTPIVSYDTSYYVPARKSSGNVVTVERSPSKRHSHSSRRYEEPRPSSSSSNKYHRSSFRNSLFPPSSYSSSPSRKSSRREPVIVDWPEQDATEIRQPLPSAMKRSATVTSSANAHKNDSRRRQTMFYPSGGYSTEVRAPSTATSSSTKKSRRYSSLLG